MIYKKMENFNDEIFDNGNPTIVLFWAMVTQVILSPIWMPIYFISKFIHTKNN
jgi:hypothetical protein